MDVDSTVNTENKEQLQVKETGDSCKHEIFETVPLTRVTDGSCTTERVSGDWSDDVKQDKNSSGDEIANVNFYAVRPGS